MKLLLTNIAHGAIVKSSDVYDGRRRLIIPIGVILFSVFFLSAGCSLKPDETQESEIKSAVKTRDNARQLQLESDKRNKAGEDVLNGK
jgi:hypothetical protein